MYLIGPYNIFAAHWSTLISGNFQTFVSEPGFKFRVQLFLDVTHSTGKKLCKTQTWKPSVTKNWEKSFHSLFHLQTLLPATHFLINFEIFTLSYFSVIFSVIENIFTSQKWGNFVVSKQKNRLHIEKWPTQKDKAKTTCIILFASAISYLGGFSWSTICKKRYKR